MGTTVRIRIEAPICGEVRGDMDAHLGLQADQARLAAVLEREAEACREGSGDGLREVEEEAPAGREVGAARVEDALAQQLAPRAHAVWHRQPVPQPRRREDRRVAACGAGGTSGSFREGPRAKQPVQHRAGHREVPLRLRVAAVHHELVEPHRASPHRLEQRGPHRDERDVVVAAELGHPVLVAARVLVLPLLVGA